MADSPYWNSPASTDTFTLRDLSVTDSTLLDVGGGSCSPELSAAGGCYRRPPGTRRWHSSRPADSGTSSCSPTPPSKSSGFMVATDVAIYFCDPKSPWQRHLREHQQALEVLSAQVERPLSVRPARPRRHRAKAQHQTPQDSGLQHPSCYTGQDRCAHR
jgi:hypothetical protein